MGAPTAGRLRPACSGPAWPARAPTPTHEPEHGRGTTRPVRPERRPGRAKGRPERRSRSYGAPSARVRAKLEAGRPADPGVVLLTLGLMSALESEIEDLGTALASEMESLRSASSKGATRRAAAAGPARRQRRSWQPARA